MALKGQTFKKYDLDYKLKVIGEKQAGASYAELSKKYSIPEGTLFTWMRILRKHGAVNVAQVGRPSNRETKYKERYEILKKFQDFLDKKGQKRK